MSKLHIDIHHKFSAIDPQEWDRCAGASGPARPVDPFMTHRFFDALEQSGSIGERSGWVPHVLEIRQKDQALGFVPMFLKSHSQGEYIFDHSWANAFEQAGGEYYPKLQVSVPFSPVTGNRFLAEEHQRPLVIEAGISAMAQLCEDHHISSAHVTFCSREESQAAGELGLLQRVNTQFHWRNDGYEDFDGFLAQLSSRKRKNIKKERHGAQASGLDITWHSGDDIRPEHWDAMWCFYQDTGARKWGSPYLTRAFFELAHTHLRDDILLMFASDNGTPIAGAMHFIGQETLFGRYWGATGHVPFMHFELCYYQAIDYAIKHRMKQIEAGAQGEHKLARGYLPQPTHSVHYIHHPDFRRAVAQYLDHERRAVDHEIDVLTHYGPFRNVNVEERD